MLTQHNFPDDFNRPSINSIYQRLRANQLFNSSICLLPSGGAIVSNPDWHMFSMETLQPWQPTCNSLTQPVTQHEEQYIRKINAMLDFPTSKVYPHT